MAIDLTRVTLFNSDFPSDGETDEGADLDSAPGEATWEAPDYGAAGSGDAGEHYNSDTPSYGAGNPNGSSPYDHLTASQRDDLREIERSPTADLAPGQTSSTDYRVYVDDQGDVYAVANPVVDANGNPVTERNLAVGQVPGATVHPDPTIDYNAPDRTASASGPMIEAGPHSGQSSEASRGGSRDGSPPNRVAAGDGRTPQSGEGRTPQSPESDDKPRPTLPGQPWTSPPPPPPTARERFVGYVRGAWDELLNRILPAIGPEETFLASGVKFLSSTAAALRLRGLAGPSSRALARALEAAGFVRNPGDAAHHLVAGSAPGARAAREVLSKFNIGINEASNGIFLPASTHARMHTKEYYDTVNEMLERAESREDALKILGVIRQKLLLGQFP